MPPQLSEELTDLLNSRRSTWNLPGLILSLHKHCLQHPVFWVHLPSSHLPSSTQWPHYFYSFLFSSLFFLSLQSPFPDLPSKHNPQPERLQGDGVGFEQTQCEREGWDSLPTLHLLLTAGGPQRKLPPGLWPHSQLTGLAPGPVNQTGKFYQSASSLYLSAKKGGKLGPIDTPTFLPTQ